MTFDQVKKCPMVNIKFSGNRNVKAHFNQIMSKDETDVATIPFTSAEYLEQAKCLNEKELKMLQNPDKLSNLKRNGCFYMTIMVTCRRLR